MDYIDYCQKLGLGFNDKKKQDIFTSRIQVLLQAHSDISFDEKQEMQMCYNIGAVCKLENKNPLDFDFSNTDPTGLQRVWLYLSDRKKIFPDFLASLIIFYNGYSGIKKDKKVIFNAIQKALVDSHIEYELLWENQDVFVFPKGAKELDDALISEPLEWLNEYPQAHKTFCIALKQYSDGIYIRDVADNLRKALESFLQEFLNNTKNLETNKNEICKYLGSQEVDASISGLYQTLINTYKNINDRIAKHNDAVDAKLLEFLLYQTGLLIRMVISIKKAEDTDNAD